MNYFTESNDLLDQPGALRKRLKEDGYLFIRDFLPKEEALFIRRCILEFCREEGWLQEGSALMDGLTDHEPLVEGSKAWRPVYAKIQALEAFHRIKLHDQMHWMMEDLFEEPVFALPMTIARIAFPNDNERGTQPHQDWFYVGGSTETLSCWAPLGDVPSEVGHENVAHLEQLQEQISTFICPHIQGYPLLMPLIIRLPGSPGPSRNEGHLVQNFVGLYLYDLGSHGRQDTTGHRQGHVGSQLDNPYPF